jgi:hypothetical protein
MNRRKIVPFCRQRILAFVPPPSIRVGGRKHKCMYGYVFVVFDGLVNLPCSLAGFVRYQTGKAVADIPVKSRKITVNRLPKKG